MKAAIYARVSTNNKGQSTDLQLSECREYCARREFAVERVYIDNGVSGAKESRPELDKLLADARKRAFDVVVVYRFDRFARSTRQLVNSLAEFQSLGIEFISIHDGADTTTPQGRLLFTIMAGLAAFERELIRERVISGLAEARRQGKKLGPKFTVSKEKANCIIASRAEGSSLRSIAKDYGVSTSTVARVLKKSGTRTDLGTIQSENQV